MVILFDQALSFGRDTYGAVTEEGDTFLAHHISRINSGDQWGDRCLNQIALTSSCSPLEGEFLRLHIFFQACKAPLGVLSLHFAFARPVLIAHIVYFLTVLHIWAGFLHVLTSCLQGLPLAAIWGMLRLLNTGWAKVVEHWGCLYQLGGSVGETSPVALGWASWWHGLLSESGPCPLEALQDPWLLFPKLLPAPQSCSTPQYSGWSGEALDLFVSVPQSWGTRCSLPSSHPTSREKPQAKEVSLGTDLCYPGEGWCG